MDETMTIWYEVTDKKYAQALRDAADCLEKTGYAKLYLENVTIPGDGSVNDPATGRVVRNRIAGIDGPGYSPFAQGGGGIITFAGASGFGDRQASGGVGGGGNCILPPDHIGPCRSD